VFGNLLNNAAKYTPNGGRIALTVETSDRDVSVTVRDSGIGIPADMLTRVFDIFTQVDRGLEKTTGGLGIGLSIARRLVEMHGGTIEARSAGPGKGSEFIVRLPAKVESAGSAPERQRRILVADDNQDAAITLAMLLEAFGNEVRVAHDGAEAVEMAASFRPDAILLDIGMPKLNGYEACERIRLQEGGARAVIVALTGWGGEEDKERARSAGFDRHLVKPIDPGMLEELVAELPVLPR
jgi:CheY-like chemotaxis protein